MNIRGRVGTIAKWTYRGKSLRAFKVLIVVFAFGIFQLDCATYCSASDDSNWPSWRGPEMNGVSRDKGLPDSWSPKGENVLWAKPEFASRATPTIMDGRLYLVCRAFPETTKEGEKTVCVDATTGELIWESVHNIFLSDAPAERIGWSSVVCDPASGNVYVLGLGCQFQCLDGKTGRTIWEHALCEEYGMLSTYGGRTNFPIVFEDLVIVSGVLTQWGDTAVPAQRFLAFDKRTGAAIWILSTIPRPEDTTYSSPVFTTFNGQAAMVFGASDGSVYAIQPRTGKIIWRYDVSARGLNTSPIVVDNIVYCGHSEKNRADTTILGAVFAFDGRQIGDITEDKLLWKVNSKAVGRSSPVYHDGRVYMIEDGAALLVIEAATGKLIAEKKLGRIMFGSPIFADGKLYCGEANGNFWVLKPTPEGVEEVARIRLNGEELLASPVVSRSRIYVASSKALYCIGTPGDHPASDPIPVWEAETPVSADKVVAHIQIVPVEAIMVPGQKTSYRVLAFNKNGQMLKSASAEFSVTGGGTIDAQGNFVAPTAAEHVAVFVTAKSGELTSTARARVIPPLPWKFNFDDKKVPLTWIGAAYRHQPKDINGESALVKISTIPKGTRSQSWMGLTRFHDYTIKADFFPAGDGERRPDMGLINQRYTLDMMEKGQLQIRSWTSRLELRFARTVPFEWQANEWYSMKFQSENGEGQVTLRGKAWKRGEPEPTDWMIEATDMTPNTNGSPGLFGNSSSAEFYIDNVEVYSNK